jgi:osmotically-inducible protein OsmY
MSNRCSRATVGAVVPASGKTDEDIRQDVLCQMAWDERLSDHQVGVQVEKGVVTLGGVVDDSNQFNAAAEAAHRVAEVLDVANELQVRGAGVDTRSDSELAVAVRRALQWDAEVQDQGIRSTVAAGVVILEGEVPSLAQQVQATRAVLRLHGVKRVDNRLRIEERT